MGISVEFKNVSKTYKDTLALKNINLKLEENKIYGLLGRNGAGKTTLLKATANQIIPTEGEVEIFNKSYTQDDTKMKLVTLVKDKNYYFKEMRVKTILKHSRMVYENWDEEFEKELIEKFNIPLNKVYKKLSDGYKGLVSIIMGLASRAPITIFDEAYINLDAVNREIFYDILREDYLHNPRTIIISTHYMGEFEGMLEEIILLDEGKVILQESMEEIERKAFIIKGNKDVINRSIKNKNIIKEEILGKHSTISVYDNFNERELRELKLEGIEVSKMPLQKWFVNLLSSMKGV